MILVLLTAFGLAAEPAPTPVPGSAPHPGVVHSHTTPAPASDVHAAVLDSLAAREFSCADVLALGSAAEVREALVHGTEQELPPWAPMRSATCLTDLAATDAVALAAVSDLVSRADQPGFALAVTQRLDALPAEQAVRIAEQALSNPSPALTRRLPTVLQSSRHDQVLALPALQASVNEP